MRVLLVNPKSHLPIDTRVSPSLGLAYLAAVSERRGDEVRIHDGDVEDTLVQDVVRAFRPDLIGISANTTQVMSAWNEAARIKEVAGEIPIVLGGPHPTVLPHESAALPQIDLVARGEGEGTWEELSERLAAGRDWRGVAGLTYRHDGEIIDEPSRAALELRELPRPAYHLFNMTRYTNVQPATDRIKGFSFPIMTSRGCPYRCSYCSQIMERRWRMRSAEDVVDEWEWLVRDLGAAEIGVLDDSFNIQRQRVLDICDLLIERRLSHIPWIMINGIRANLTDEELLGKMRAAGCVRTAFGVESGNQEILDSVIHKQLTLDQVRSAFAAAKKVNMETIGFFMIGMPGETEQTMEETIRFACELDPLVANFSIATPFPGTEMYDMVREHGRILADNWDDFVFFEGTARFEYPNLPAELVERKWKEAYRRFYLRPRRVLRTLGRKQTWLDLPRTIRMAWQTIMPTSDSHSAGEP
jgi:anaerobic magnesium-protoporphyrin IX monomethyl ester cyclase